MVRLRVLGGFALESSAGVPVGPLSQRRAEAVLTILAVAGDLGCTRDRLVALLWPESDGVHAHHNLRDALHAIRHSLGADVIVGTGATIRLSPVVDSDVRGFLRSLAGSQLVEAVALYGGPLLDGFHVERAAEFEHWVDRWRSRLLRECMDAVERLAEDAEHGERWRDASKWWARAEELDPFCTPVVVRRMRALARAGDVANALKDGEAHHRRLVEEFDVEPDVALFEEVVRLRGGSVRPAQAESPSAPRRGQIRRHPGVKGEGS
ncbi:MAG: BTAD domain-containing putative transcriptional regulator [Gemmatimonadetes bacterium]|nr:BTAD domain-containing putative transcriptional regulator [Gemmatimonadota bacterium]